MESFFSATTKTGLFLMLLTPAAYLIAKAINRKLAGHQLVHPLILSVIFVISILIICDTSYTNYVDKNRLFEWLIGPAVVSLALPLYKNLKLIKRWLGPILLTIITLVVVNPALIWFTSTLLDLQPATQVALSTKSVTTPIALSINNLLSGNPSLAAGLVMATGICGALLAPPLLKALKIKDPEIKGIALGLTSHAIGTQRAFEISPICGAFAALTMILTGVIVSLVLPTLGLLFAI